MICRKVTGRFVMRRPVRPGTAGACIAFLLAASSLWGCAIGARQAVPGESVAIVSFADPEVEKVLADVSDQRALFVFDVDNTLLAFPTEQFVGSDHWYQWQRDLPDSSPRKINCVFEMQAIAFRLQAMEATEDGYSARFVRSLQDRGFDVIGLTARGHDVRSVTERELARNGFDFARSSPRGHPGIPAAYVPSKSREIPAPREASFQNGLVMAAGQHKGAMLGDLLTRLDIGKHYDAVVFFDDVEKNVRAVADWFDGRRIAAHAFHYQGEAASFQGHDPDVTDAETAALLGVFAVFDREAQCLRPARRPDG